VRVQRDHHRVVAEVSSSPVPVTSVLVSLAAFQFAVSAVGITIFGPVSLQVLLPSWLAWGALACAARFHMQRVVLTITPEEAVLDVAYPFGRKRSTRIPISRLLGSKSVVGVYSWWLALEVQQRGVLYVPCSTRADARRLSEYLQVARSQAPPPAPPPPPPEALLQLRSRPTQTTE
jgi:hypothetical protein